MGRHEKISGRERSARYRAKMRAKGYRLKQFWLPDVTSPEFIAQAREDARAIAASEDSADAQAFINSVVDDLWSDPGHFDAIRNTD